MFAFRMRRLEDIQDRLKEQEIKDLQTITERLVQSKKAMTIILFGSYAKGKQTFVEYEDGYKKSDYDIVIVTGPTHNAKRDVERHAFRLFDDFAKRQKPIYVRRTKKTIRAEIMGDSQ